MARSRLDIQGEILPLRAPVQTDEAGFYAKQTCGYSSLAKRHHDQELKSIIDEFAALKKMRLKIIRRKKKQIDIGSGIIFLRRSVSGGRVFKNKKKLKRKK